MGIKITFKTGTPGDANYYVYADGIYAGSLTRTDDKRPMWSVTPTGGVASEAIYRTRKAAVESIMPFATVEVLARVHWANATSEDRTMSAGDSPTYLASRRALVEGIAATYPDMNAQDVYYQWTEHGETILQTVRAMRQEAEDLAAYRAEEARLDAEAERVRAEWEAGVDAQDATRKPVSCAVCGARFATVEASMGHEHMAESSERKALIVVTPVGNRTAVAVQFTASTISPDAIISYSPAGTPISGAIAFYNDAGAAWRMVDVMVGELSRDVAPWEVTVAGTRPDRAYEGTVYAGATACCHDQALYPTPTYRAAGFPSLDAAIGGSYAHS